MSRRVSRIQASKKDDKGDAPKDLTPKEQGRYSKMVEELQKMGMTPAKAKVSFQRPVNASSPSRDYV